MRNDHDLLFLRTGLSFSQWAIVSLLLGGLLAKSVYLYTASPNAMYASFVFMTMVFGLLATRAAILIGTFGGLRVLAGLFAFFGIAANAFALITFLSHDNIALRDYAPEGVLYMCACITVVLMLLYTAVFRENALSRGTMLQLLALQPVGVEQADHTYRMDVHRRNVVALLSRDGETLRDDPENYSIGSMEEDPEEDTVTGWKID